MAISARATDGPGEGTLLHGRDDGQGLTFIPIGWDEPVTCEAEEWALGILNQLRGKDL